MLDDQSEAERLDRAIDATLRGEPGAFLDGADASLLAAFAQIRALAENEPVDSHLKRDLWRSMMSTGPTAYPRQPNPNRNGRPPHTIELARSRSSRGAARSRLGETITTLTLIALLVIGFVGYRQFGGDEDRGRTRIPAVSQPATPTGPTVSGCATQPREPGTVEALAGTPPSRGATLPRMNNDPLYSEALGSDEPVNGETLLLSSEPDPALIAPVTAVVEQLVACRIYAHSSPLISDLDGRYWALYSDDFFRRELSGYREAGLPIAMGSYWMPSTVPTVVETRVLIGDSRVLAILGPSYSDSPTQVLILEQSGDRWLIDEVGTVLIPTDDSAYAATPPALRGRLPRLDIALYDARPMATPTAADPAMPERWETVCDPLLGDLMVPCLATVHRFGPYVYNEFPADTDFTVTLYNLGSETRRFTVAELGIDVTVAPDDAVSFVLNAGPGEYLYLIYEGTNPEPIDSGIFGFVGPDEPASAG